MHIIYVDDEQLARDNFRLTVDGMHGVETLQLFRTGQEALEWAQHHEVDAAFLDMEMASMHGLQLARALHAISEEICVVFVTAFSQFALDAFAADAVGYILKPYTREDVRKELRKVKRFASSAVMEQSIVITTIPTLSMRVDGMEMRLPNNKCKELLAFFVDRAGVPVSSGEIISCLWPDRANDESTGTLLRVTYNRLLHLLEAAGAEDILVSRNRQRWLVTERVDCDLYRILAGETDVGKSYAGEYLRDYSWAESTNARLANMLNYMDL